MDAETDPRVGQRIDLFGPLWIPDVEERSEWSLLRVEKGGPSLGEARAAIVGHDWGAPVEWNAALLRPGLFRAVVVFASAISLPEA